MYPLDEYPPPSYVPSTSAILVQLLVLAVNTLIFIVAVNKTFHGFTLAIFCFFGFLCFRKLVWVLIVGFLTKELYMTEFFLVTRLVIVFLWMMLGLYLISIGGWGKEQIPWIGSLLGLISTYPTIERLKYEMPWLFERSR